MKKNYELVIFDLDGTLLDTSCGILSSVAYALQVCGISYGKEICAEDFIGPPIEASLRRHLSLEGALLERAAREFRQHYKNEDLLKAATYEGMEELLLDLRRTGHGRAVATYKREAAAERLLWHYGLDKHLNIIHGTNDGHPMTKAELILRCIEDYGLTSPQQAVMVGDTTEDAKGAEQAGVDFIAVTYGFEFTEKTAPQGTPCIGVATRPAEILPLVRAECAQAGRNIYR